MVHFRVLQDYEVESEALRAIRKLVGTTDVLRIILNSHVCALSVLDHSGKDILGAIKNKDDDSGRELTKF